MKKEYAAFIEKIQSKNHPFEEEEQQQILRALDITGAPAAACNEIAIGAASLLLDLGADADTIVAILILERFNSFNDKGKDGKDHPLPQNLSEQFGTAASELVLGVKKIDALKTANTSIAEAQNIRNMLFALTDDIRVLLIKLAQKLHATRLLDKTPEKDEERKLAGKENLDIYAPIANRMGISWLKNELEDLALKFLNRDTYRQIKSMIHEKRGERSRFLEFAQETVKKEAAALGFNVDVKSRAKHFYSVYMKMRKRGKSESEIQDLFAMRIICDSVENCYTLLGVIHRLWQPVRGAFDDYIAKPKPNGYQSLHTTVMVGMPPQAAIGVANSEAYEGESEEKMLEVQIRTSEMHQMAENGVASHFLYKKGSSKDVVNLEDIGNVNKLKNWKQTDTYIPGEWLKNIKQEILGNWVFVFTPQGKVIKLKEGSTPIDFAYRVHSAVGERCAGAKANGAIIPLSSHLKNTDTIEIMTNSAARPRASWLELVKSQKIRSKIRSWLEENDPAFSVDKPPEKTAEKALEKKKPAALEVVSAAKQEVVVQKTVSPLSSVLKVRIGSEKNLMVSFARCCNPVTGDLITGYVSRGRGIIIHRSDCPSLAKNTEYDKRKIEADWENADSARIKRFRLEARFTANLFSEIEGAIRNCGCHLIEGRLEETQDSRLAGFFTLQLAQESDLKSAVKNMRGIPGMLSINLC